MASEIFASISLRSVSVFRSTDGRILASLCAVDVLDLLPIFFFWGYFAQESDDFCPREGLKNSQTLDCNQLEFAIVAAAAAAVCGARTHALNFASCLVVDKR
jgi:hypothetical protein